MKDRCRREIDALHDFFEGWFTARIDASEAAFARVEQALAPDFTMITPAGVCVQRDELLASLRSAHGAHAELQPAFRIWIRAASGRVLSAGLAHFTYEEWQLDANGESGRQSSVIFEDHPAAPGGVRWLFVHETWLPATSTRE